MPQDEINELRRDIKGLSINIATLTQKIEDINVPIQPCVYHKEHLDRYHKDTVSDKIKDRAINTITTALILAILGYIWIGFVGDINQQQLKQQKTTKEVVKER